MGCIVNGPGESKHANIGISLPGDGEKPIAPVFIDGQKTHTLKGENIISEFKSIIFDYVQKNYKKSWIHFSVFSVFHMNKNAGPHSRCNPAFLFFILDNYYLLSVFLALISFIFASNGPLSIACINSPLIINAGTPWIPSVDAVDLVWSMNAVTSGVAIFSFKWA